VYPGSIPGVASNKTKGLAAKDKAYSFSSQQKVSVNRPLDHHPSPGFSMPDISTDNQD
jgi:hypothetical protein